MIKSKFFTNPVCNTCVLFFRSDCFPKNYDEKEVADANTLKHAPDRKDGGGRKKKW